MQAGRKTTSKKSSGDWLKYGKAASNTAFE